VFVKISYLSSWVFTAMQSVHNRMNSSLSPSKKILDPPMQPLVAEITRCGFIGACTFFIEFSINFKRGQGQIVFSISQIT